MKHTISVLVENHAGVLSRIAGLFSRRGFNIESLAVGVTDDESVSRITIVVGGDDYLVDQVEKQLGKLVEVIKLKTHKENELISRELMLVKVKADHQNRGDIMDIAQLTGAKICDLSQTTVTLEISDTTDKIGILLDILKGQGILEVIRTGTIAAGKGAQALAAGDGD